MILNEFDLKFVIAFPIKDNHVLLIKRNKEPWFNKWNGAGGKIELGETVFHAVCRELLEETKINLHEAKKVRFVGIVTWETGQKVSKIPGMYAYISYLSPQQSIQLYPKESLEGTIAWKPISWALDKSNTEIADNVPYYLSYVLSAKQPMRYHCLFSNNILKRVEIFPLPPILSTSGVE